jgi:iron complex outermembrane receptor protein
MGTASVLVLASAGARAEETAAETDEAVATLDDTQGGAEYGEVVVTADKREVSLQKAPAAITALPAEALEQANIKSAVDLNGVVPGLP